MGGNGNITPDGEVRGQDVRNYAGQGYQQVFGRSPPVDYPEEPVWRPTDPALQFFAYRHLPEHLQDFSRRFAELADWIVRNVCDNPQRDIGLQKLIEAKDCVVRASIWKDEP